jgi:hypothetical protein
VNYPEFTGWKSVAGDFLAHTTIYCFTTSKWLGMNFSRFSDPNKSECRAKFDFIFRKQHPPHESHFS